MDALVERAFVITLRNRPDRIKAFWDVMPQVDWLPEVEEWPAIHGDTCQPPDNWSAGAGAWGCYKSHLNILEYCLNTRVSSYLVFEDDAQFASDFDVAGRHFLKSLPDGWQQAYLGGQLMHAHTHAPVRVSDWVYRPYNVNRTHCFAVGREGMLPMYQHICDLPFEPKFHIDHHLGRWHEDARTKVYCPPVWLVGQHGSPSSVSGKNEPVEFYEPASTYCLDHWLYKTPFCFLWRSSPQLLAECQGMLHAGNQISGRGFDVTLEEASRLRRPWRAINGWYHWVVGEIAKESVLERLLPCAYHPQISKEDIEEAIPGIEVEVLEGMTSVNQVKAICDAVLMQYEPVGGKRLPLPDSDDEEEQGVE